MIAPSVSDLRMQLLDELQRDLIGPHSETEQLSDPPTVEYLTGILYPSGVELTPEEDERLEIDTTEEEDETDTDVVILSRTMNPASLGLSFAVERDIDHLEVEIDYGLYTKCGERRTDGWQRQQIHMKETVPLFTNKGKRELENGGSLEWVVRPESVRLSVSLFLVNRNALPDQSNSSDFPDIDALCLFQPRLQVHGPGDSCPFLHRVPGGTLPIDADLESYDLLYRNSHEFAIGHGCAVDWEDVQGDHAGTLKTAQVPTYELPATIPNTMMGLEMVTLGNARTPDEVSTLLNPVLHAYEQWIRERRAEVPDLPSQKLRDTANVHLDLCSQALGRMRTGLELLRKVPQIFEAFRFANRAMLLQRSYGKWMQQYRRTGKRETATPEWVGSWRPFQIAFILLNLPGIADPESDDRNLVDLLWFPTGGGKTEAYLGLTAFTLALRRLRGKINGMNGDGGVTVIMRYTLRLLTTQQFQRATTLICACEYLRRQAPQKWGKRPFQIGLWVGAGATPNNIKDAEEALIKLRNGVDVKEGNPVQLPFCPWCGEKLTAWNYHIDQNRGQMALLCSRKECVFHGTEQQLDKGIPALLVDEDIYHECPSLLLATVDKFARLPWQPLTMALFGRVDRCCPKHGYLVHTDTDHPAKHRAVGKTPAVVVENCEPFLPPELIIQDELHLISGPLGTLSGLYETAIDLLCSYTGSNEKAVRPKIVASTATIRRAADQVLGLFAREVRLFPPSGLNTGDSFFAQAQPLSQRPGRYYIGVNAPGRSVKTALVRVYALLLQVAGEQVTRYGSNVADAYTTLLGYFNSLRELGGALRLVEDDIVQRIEYLANRRGQQAREIKNENRELTSRIASSKIPEILKQLEIPAGSPEAIDVLLATNMISVGVDIDRLGLMVVNGQPKTSAEYIQATSRIGRQPNAPGLVVTVYNWSRPRDISHYERFRPYHEEIYRHVEATSVTPFAPRARDRALHAVLIALARILREQWAANNAADRFDASHPAAIRIKTFILERVSQIDQGSVNDVSEQLTALMDWWRTMITRYRARLRYAPNPYKPGEQTPVLIHPAEEQRSGGSRPTLNSLREVEGESALFIDWSN